MKLNQKIVMSIKHLDRNLTRFQVSYWLKTLLKPRKCMFSQLLLNNDGLYNPASQNSDPTLVSLFLGGGGGGE
jgi:hypothetical protein